MPAIAVAAMAYFMVADGRVSPMGLNSATDGSCSTANKVAPRSPISTDDASAGSAPVAQNVADKNPLLDEAVSSPPNPVLPNGEPVFPEGSDDSSVRLQGAPSPPTDWNADEATYRARAADESLPESVRSDARAKLTFRFAEWRGRNERRLGGFEFRAAEIGLLDGWVVDDAKESWIGLRPNEQPRYVERCVWLKRGSRDCPSSQEWRFLLGGHTRCCSQSNQSPVWQRTCVGAT